MSKTNFGARRCLSPGFSLQFFPRMAADSSIDELANTIASNLGERYGFGGGGGNSRSKQQRDPTASGPSGIKGLKFDDEDFAPSASSADMHEMMEDEEGEEEEELEEEEEEDSGYGMEVPEGEEEGDPSTEEGFYDHIRSPEMRAVARRRGWTDIAEAAAGAREGEDEDPAERAKRLTVVSASGKPMGQHVPRVKYSLQDAFKRVGGASSIVPALGAEDGGGDESDEESTSIEPGGEGLDDGNGGGRKRSRDERDETTQAVVSILNRFGAKPSNDVLERLKEGERVLRRDEHRLERAKKRRRLEAVASATDRGEEEEEEPSSSYVGGSSKARSDRDQEREYLRPRYKSSGVEYERFLQTYCPLCGYGDRVNDAIYAPKLAVIREMAETGVMEGDIGTLAHDLCTVWNEHIYKPMLAEGRRAMRLTYDMCRHHLLKPHRPDPRPMMRRDIEDLTMLIQIINATIYTENGLTREGSVDAKMVAASINLYKTKYMIAGKRPETMAFYNPNFNFNERAAGGFVNPYQKVHYGGRRITRASKR